MGVILPLAASPFADVTNGYATYQEMTYELAVPFGSPLAQLLRGDLAALTARWQEFKGIVLAGNIPRWVKEMAGVSVALTTGSVSVQQIFMHSLEAQGVHATWLDELRRTHLDPFLLPDDIQVVVMFARDAALVGFADGADTAILREIGFSADDIDEIVAAIDLFIRASQQTLDRSKTAPIAQRAALAG